MVPARNWFHFTPLLPAPLTSPISGDEDDSSICGRTKAEVQCLEVSNETHFTKTMV